ncbi:MAG TPA: hypothetical protein VE593_01550 [Nitrososphaeraceae archaeon]|nr:hypothetical protein [Nitrososphaeraceae archaeon]
MTAILRPLLYTAFATSRTDPLPITIRSNVFVLDTQVNGIFHNHYLFSVVETFGLSAIMHPTESAIHFRHAHSIILLAVIL